jgi:hypothetical protein
MKTMIKKEAVNNGYRALTTGYVLPKEKWMLDNVLADMKRGNIDTVIVPVGNEVEVWRRAPLMAY